MSDMILKEFGFEFIPFNQIGSSLVHILDLGLFEIRARFRLAKKSKCKARVTSVSEGIEVKI